MDTSSYSNTQPPVNGASATGGRRMARARHNPEMIREELSAIKSDLDALVNRAASMNEEELARAHAQIMARFSSMRYAARGFADEASRQFNRGVETTHQYVKEKPMQSVGLAVGTGLLLGLLFARR